MAVVATDGCVLAADELRKRTKHTQHKPARTQFPFLGYICGPNSLTSPVFVLSVRFACTAPFIIHSAHSLEHKRNVRTICGAHNVINFNKLDLENIWFPLGIYE